MNNYTFVFAVMGECCVRPHLWVQSSRGRTRNEAYRTALRQVQSDGLCDVTEVLEIKEAVGCVEEVEEEEVEEEEVEE